MAILSQDSSLVEKPRDNLASKSHNYPLRKFLRDYSKLCVYKYTLIQISLHYSFIHNCQKLNNRVPVYWRKMDNLYIHAVDYHLATERN